MTNTQKQQLNESQFSLKFWQFWKSYIFLRNYHLNSFYDKTTTKNVKNERLMNFSVLLFWIYSNTFKKKSAKIPTVTNIN